MLFPLPMLADANPASHEHKTGCDGKPDFGNLHVVEQ